MMKNKMPDKSGIDTTSKILGGVDDADMKIGDSQAQQLFGKDIKDLNSEELSKLIAGNPKLRALAEFLQKPNYEKSMEAQKIQTDGVVDSQKKGDHLNEKKTKGHQPDNANVFRPKRPG